MSLLREAFRYVYNRFLLNYISSLQEAFRCAYNGFLSISLLQEAFSVRIRSISLLQEAVSVRIQSISLHFFTTGNIFGTHTIDFFTFLYYKTHLRTVSTQAWNARPELIQKGKVIDFRAPKLPKPAPKPAPKACRTPAPFSKLWLDKTLPQFNLNACTSGLDRIFAFANSKNRSAGAQAGAQACAQDPKTNAPKPAPKQRAQDSRADSFHNI